jgi:hypothetical protein
MTRTRQRAASLAHLGGRRQSRRRVGGDARAGCQLVGRPGGRVDSASECDEAEGRARTRGDGERSGCATTERVTSSKR